MRKFYSEEKYWYKSYPAIILYLIYLICIEIADKNDHAIFILICSQCGIPFLAKNCNRGRSDILCTFGCRQRNKKSKARKRSQKYRQKDDKKQIKKKLNRKRSLKGDELKKDSSNKKTIDPFIIYIKLVLQSILKIKIQIQEIIQIQKKVRSRGLDFYQRFIHYVEDG